MVVSASPQDRGLLPLLSSARATASVRDRLLHLVHDEPGLNKSEACSRLGVAWGTVSHHVARLERDGLLVREARGRDVLLFASGTGVGLRRSAPALRDELAARLLLVLGQRRQASLVEVAAALSVSRKVARRVVRSLQAAGLVHNQAPGRPRYTRAQPAAVAPRPVAPLVRLAPRRQDLQQTTGLPLVAPMMSA